jgi:hypothetical protein
MIHETDGGGDDYGLGYIRGVERSRDMHFFDKQLNQAEAHDGQQLHPSAVAGRRETYTRDCHGWAFRHLPRCLIIRLAYGVCAWMGLAGCGFLNCLISPVCWTWEAVDAFALGCIWVYTDRCCVQALRSVFHPEPDSFDSVAHDPSTAELDVMRALRNWDGMSSCTLQQPSLPSDSLGARRVGLQVCVLPALRLRLLLL